MIGSGLYFELSDYNFSDDLGSKQDIEFQNYERAIAQEIKYSDNLSRLYSFIPWQTLSRLWGWATHLEWTYMTWFKVLQIKAFIAASGANLDEALVQDLEWYPSVNAFFRRQLKPGARKVDTFSKMVSPSDGKVLSFGRIGENENYMVEQVKGLNYSLKGLLGPMPERLKTFKHQASEQFEIGSGDSFNKREMRKKIEERERLLDNQSFSDLPNETYVKSLLRNPEIKDPPLLGHC